MTSLNRISKLFENVYFFVQDSFTLISSIAAVLGVVVAYLSFANAADNINKQLEGQKKAASVSMVSDYMAIVSGITLLGSTIKESNKNEAWDDFEQLVISRTNLILEGEQYPDLNAQVIKFLSSNSLGRLFDQSRTPLTLSEELKHKQNHIDIRKIDMSGQNLDKIYLVAPNVECSDLSGTMLNNATFNKATIIASDFSSSSITGSSFRYATMMWVNFSDSILSSSTDFTGASLLYSNLTGIKSKNQDNDKFLQALSKVSSLYGSKLDERTIHGLIDLKGEDGEDEVNKLLNDKSLAYGKDNKIKDDIKPVIDRIDKPHTSEDSWAMRKKDFCSD